MEMLSHVSRRAVSRSGAVLAGISLVLAAVGIANAGSGWPTGISVAQTGLTVTASGTWSWPEMDTNPKLSWTGYALSWGDVASGNTLGAYHLGDGTAATNLVTEIPGQGDNGPWGPVDHTYAAPGAYTVCAIIYDLGEVKPFKTVGYHSTKASGTSRNSDNSVDNQTAPPVACATIEVGTATASPTATEALTEPPSAAPTVAPTAAPTAAPTEAPTAAPTEAPTAATSEVPTATPTGTPVPLAVPAAVTGGAAAGGQPEDAALSITLSRASSTGSASPGTGGGGDRPLPTALWLALLVAGLGALGTIAVHSTRAVRK
jgi:hypothetical protein